MPGLSVSRGEEDIRKEHGQHLVVLAAEKGQDTDTTS